MYICTMYIDGTSPFSLEPSSPVRKIGAESVGLEWWCVVRPWLEQGFIRKGKIRWQWWRLGLGRGGVWRGRVHKGPRQAAGADARGPALCTTRWG